MTELIWEGKYDKNGKKNGPVRIALPFQTIETVNESAEDRERTLDLFAQGRPTEWRNRLIWGDKKYVLPSLLPEFAGKINLIYIDPPFDTGADFSFTATIPDNPETPEDETTQFIKTANILEQKAYRDTWGTGINSINSYLPWFYETIIILRELLADDGVIFVHIDWHIGHYAKIILDETFGYENFRNEIFVKRVRKNVRVRKYVKSLNVAVDTILFYAKSINSKILPPMKPDKKGEYWHSFEAQGYRKGMDYSLFGQKPKQNNHWRWIEEKAEKAIKISKLRPNPNTGKPEYLVESRTETLCDSFWNDIQAYTFKYGYPTEKNELLLERIINSGSIENDLILDCFIGAGTTAAVAEKLNRRWIACDLGRFAIHTTRKRLLGIPDLKPFVVQNLGKYERQQWMGAEFQSTTEKAAKEQRYRHFILKLYHAEPVSGYSWLHGAKAGRMVHVGSVDSPVAIGDVKNIVQEFWKSAGKSEDIAVNGVDILGWDFAFEINETSKQYAAANKVDLKFKKIPTEVLEKRAVEQGDIKFYELASLSVKTIVTGNNLTIRLTDFIVPPDDVPKDVQTNITHWQQWIDYWAVDWNFRDDTFHNEWQSYRTKKDPSIELEISNKYEEKGTYQVVIKVIDILGNDTTKMVNIKI